MSMKLALALCAVVLALTACNGSSDKAAPSAPGTTAADAVTSPTPTPTPAAPKAPSLRAAVKAYSDAFLTGDAKGSYALLSARCQKRETPADWAGIVGTAKDMYGNALPIKTFHAQVSGDLARVTYTYDVSAINQDSEPWVLEGGAWREDDC